MKAFRSSIPSPPNDDIIMQPKLSDPHYPKFHFARKACKYKDPSLKHHRKHLYYLREFQFQSGLPSHNNSKSSLTRYFKHSSLKTVFKVIQKIHLKVKKFNQLDYLFRTKRTLSHFTLELDRAKIPKKLLKRVIMRSSNSRIKDFSLWRETGEFKAIELAQFIRYLDFFSTLEVLTIEIDYSPLFTIKGAAATSLECALKRLRSLKEVNFDYKLAVLSKEYAGVIGRVFSKLPKLKEFRPKLFFTETNSTKELEFMHHLSNSKSLEMLNIELEATTKENVKTLAECVHDLTSLKKLIISMTCHQIVAVQNPLWMSLSNLQNLEELELEVKFFRTSSIPDDFFDNFELLSNLILSKKLKLTLKDKTNSQSLQRMWETLISFKNLKTFKLILKKFKLVKEDYQFIGDVLQAPKELKDLELNFVEMGFHFEKEFFQAISNGITSKEREEMLERLSLRFKVGDGTELKGVLHGKYQNLKQFEFEGEVHFGHAGNSEELRLFIEQNCLIKELALKLRNRKEKEKEGIYKLVEELYKKDSTEDYMVDHRSVEELLTATKKLNHLEKLELVLAPCKKTHGSIDLIMELIKEYPHLKEVKMDFSRGFLIESELTALVTLCEKKIFRRLEVKDNMDRLSNHGKGLVKNLNKKYGNLKDPKEDKI